MNFLRRNPWPLAIIAWFAVFIFVMAAWIVYALRQNLDLVRHDYYEEEVRYQQQLDCMNRTQPLRSELRIAYDPVRQSIMVALPSAHVFGAKGSIRLYRPSDARLDHEVPLTLAADGTQHIDATHLRAGLWKVRVRWWLNNQEYFFDQSLVLTGS